MQQGARIPSNRMLPSVPSRLTPAGWIMLSAIGIGAIYLCIWEPMIIVVCVIFAAFACVVGLLESRRERRIANERQGESICTFARQFNCRATDTWIVRAVFEELAHYVRFPIRAQDRLEDDLRIDSDDIPEIAEAVAQRTGRSLEDGDANPLYGKVKTVGELVQFFAHQPKRLVDHRTSLR